jgi:hypothetical protein
MEVSVFQWQTRATQELPQIPLTLEKPFSTKQPGVTFRRTPHPPLVYLSIHLGTQRESCPRLSRWQQNWGAGPQDPCWPSDWVVRALLWVGLCPVHWGKERWWGHTVVTPMLALGLREEEAPTREPPTAWRWGWGQSEKASWTKHLLSRGWQVTNQKTNCLENQEHTCSWAKWAYDWLNKGRIHLFHKRALKRFYYCWVW